MLTAKVSVKQHQNKPQAFTFNFMLKNHYYPYLPYIPPKTVKEKKKKTTLSRTSSLQKAAEYLRTTP